MNNEIRQLEPRALWRHFAELNAVPRPSKKEQRAVDLVRDFGHRLALETRVDGKGNVVIRKPATPGQEDRVTVVLQGHLDMVAQKNAETVFDFESQGIRMVVDGDWVRAQGTTLGADNGIGVAAIMAILESDGIAHPEIEALFTVDEESGMTGALALADDALTGSIMLNLDSEEETELTIGCAGAVTLLAEGSYPEEEPGLRDTGFLLRVRGLTGGHSGMDIHRGRGNANKLINRLLFLAAEELDLGIGSIDAGGLRNAIPREAVARVAVEARRSGALRELVARETEFLCSEHGTTDPGLEVALEPADLPRSLLARDFQARLLSAVYACPNGIFRMSPDIEGLVQTSNSLAKVFAAEGKYQIHTLARSSVDSEKRDLARAVQCALEPIGATVELAGAYPGWAPRPEAPLVGLLSGLYRELFGGTATVLACHAGLECGIVGAKYPHMQMISFGPNIRGAHSPDEKVQISSVQRFWRFLVGALARMPAAEKC